MCSFRCDAVWESMRHNGSVRHKRPSEAWRKRLNTTHYKQNCTPFHHIHRAAQPQTDTGILAKVCTHDVLVGYLLTQLASLVQPPLRPHNARKVQDDLAQHDVPDWAARVIPDSIAQGSACGFSIAQLSCLLLLLS